MLVVKKISQKRKIHALNNAKASLAIEGLYLNVKEDELLLKRVNGEITNAEFLARAMEIARNVQ